MVLRIINGCKNPQTLFHCKILFGPVIFSVKKIVDLYSIMRKKYIAIAVFFIFFLAQFGRIINFCCCAISVYQQTNGFTCDCERQLFSAIKTDKHSNDQAPQTIYAQLPVEKLHTGPASPVLLYHLPLNLSAWPANRTPALSYVFSEPVFHPPLLFS